MISLAALNVPPVSLSHVKQVVCLALCCNAQRSQKKCPHAVCDRKLRFEPGGAANRARVGDVVDILFIGLFRDAVFAELGHASFGRFARLFFLLPILVELPALFVVSSIV